MGERRMSRFDELAQVVRDEQDRLVVNVATYALRGLNTHHHRLRGS